jgi:6-methylsalicylate decarboxylase
VKPGHLRYDVHQHLWPAEVLRELRRRNAPPWLRDDVFQAPGRPPLPVGPFDHDLVRRLSWLDDAGIDVAVVSLSPTDGFDAPLQELWHDGIAKMAAAAAGRILPLACDRPRPSFGGVCVPAAAVTAGLGGLPSELVTAGQVLFVHPGPARPAPTGVPAWWSPALEYCVQMQYAFTAWLARDAASYPALPAVFAILGGGAPLLMERFDARGADLDFGRHRNVVVDTASYGEGAIGQFIRMFGTDQLVHGSDAPVLSPCAAIDCLRALGGDVADAVSVTTPSRLFGSAR